MWLEMFLPRSNSNMVTKNCIQQADEGINTTVVAHNTACDVGLLTDNWTRANETVFAHLEMYAIWKLMPTLSFKYEKRNTQSLI